MTLLRSPFCGQEKEDCCWFTGKNGVAMKSKKPSKPDTIARVVIRLLAPLFGAEPA